jgi:hypothetical protein
METQFRPYTLVATLDTTTASSIELRDTNNDLLDCNYISVECSGGNNNFFAISYDAPNIVTPAANQSTANSLIGDTSGITGGIAKSNGGIVELLLSDADRVNTIKLSQNTNQAQLYIITYAQVQTGNTLRDNLRPIGS